LEFREKEIETIKENLNKELSTRRDVEAKNLDLENQIKDF
jgi:hypothetical protein